MSIDFSQFAGSVVIPNRSAPIEFLVQGLGVEREGGLERIKPFLESRLSAVDTALFYTNNTAGVELCMELERSVAGSKIEAYVVDDAIHRTFEGIHYRSSRSEDMIRSRFILVHVTDESGCPLLPSQAVRSLLVRYWALGDRALTGSSIVLVLLHSSFEETPLESLCNPYPTCYLSTGKTGSGRMGPTLRSFAERAGRRLLSLDYMDSQRYRRVMSERRVQNGDYSPTLTDFRFALDGQTMCGGIEAANWFDFVQVHKSPRIADLRGIKYMDFILLLRDPRDSLVSHMIYMDQKGGSGLGRGGREKYMLEMIEQESQYICQEFVEAERDERIFCLRFEDVDRDPFDAYGRLLYWLTWNLAMTEEQFAADIRLGMYRESNRLTVAAPLGSV